MSDDSDRNGPVSTEELAAVERRSDGRIRVATEVTMRSISNFTALGTDLSVGGLYIVAPDQIREGVEVELEFYVDGVDSKFRAVGEVKWCREHPVGEKVWWGHGIEFHEMDSGGYDRLEEFVERRKPLEELGAMPPLDEN